MDFLQAPDYSGIGDQNAKMRKQLAFGLLTASPDQIKSIGGGLGVALSKGLAAYMLNNQMKQQQGNVIAPQGGMGDYPTGGNFA